MTTKRIVYNRTIASLTPVRLTNQPEITQFGNDHDMPVPNDYDADGKCDIAVWRFENSDGATDNGTWFIRQSGLGNSVRYEHWGQTGDTPVPANYRR